MATVRGRLQVIGTASAILAASACSSDDARTEQFPTQPQGVSQLAGFPPGWIGGTQKPDQYELGRDLEIVRGGRSSAYLRSRSAEITSESFIALTQLIRADRFRGHRVRLSGYLKVSSITGPGAGLWLRGDSPGRSKLDNMDTRRRVGTEDWRLAEVVVDMPADAIGIAFGALLTGPGIAWIDDLRLEVVGPEVPVTPAYDSPNGADSAALAANYGRTGPDPVNMDFEGLIGAETEAATVEWFRSKSFEFATDDPTAGDADLEPLRTMIGGAGLVALGEATHGTRQFFRMKHRVFSYLVRHLGFTHFGIEASLPEALAVDRYVQTGLGDPISLVRGMHFWTWSTEEVVALVQWMRAWNAAGNQPRVHFTGFDMQHPGVAIDSVVTFTIGINRALGDSVYAAYGCLAPFRNVGTKSPDVSGYFQLDRAQQDACRARVNSVDSLFANRYSAWAAIAGVERTDLMQRLARLVSQWEDHARPSGGSRDRYMAENAAWWRSRPGVAGTMLWAHNGHISRYPFAMGSHLAAQYGTDYVNVAQTFSAGFFNAIHQLPSGSLGALMAHNVSGAWPASIETLFDATGMQRAIFDARVIPDGGPIGESLRRRLTIRTIGAVFAPLASPAIYQAQVVLPDDYDLVIWFRDTGSSRLLASSSVGLSTSSIAP
ncbi:MAG TPA: erythromycin esterase family protein [Gemmatimonadaceae bacterium]|nr:erythromycin esterase family protein [Gemmatimonadaceae bacterium]